MNTFIRANGNIKAHLEGMSIHGFDTVIDAGLDVELTAIDVEATGATPRDNKNKIGSMLKNSASVLSLLKLGANSLGGPSGG